MTDNDINDFLMHYGMPRRSGRYPWGSGEDPFQRTHDFLSRVKELKKSGLSEEDIAKGFGISLTEFNESKKEAEEQRMFIMKQKIKSMKEDGHSINDIANSFKKQGLSEKEIADAFELSTTQLRVQKSLARTSERQALHDQAVKLREEGKSLNEIARIMGYNNDSSVRALLNEKAAKRMDQAENVKELLKKHIDEKGMIDVGVGIERELGVSSEKLNQALHMLELEGYNLYKGRLEQVTNPGQFTTLKVIGKPGTEHKDMYDPTKVHSIKDYDTETGECNVAAFVYPKSLDSKRVTIRYAEEGGDDRDGTIEIRRGVQDLSLGNSHYSQVRVLVDGTHYLKGVAVYKDDSNFPPGVDVVFNTNKSKGTPKEKVFKPIHKEDPDNPFGSTIKADGQSYYIDKKTGKRELSCINKRADEGDWKDWKDYLPSQFLSKQKESLIKKQLSLTLADKQAELDEIMKIDNPTVRRHFLSKFAEDCDSAAEHLKAAALPRQKYQVILPVPSLKDDECYAPNFDDGEKVALVRFPHGGTFEIPILKVNNKNKEGKEIMGTNPKDAIGINKKVADRLSGADFDGDTAMVIPVGRGVNITSTPELKGLKGFNNKKEYPYREGMKVLTEEAKGKEMGVISNLITDMTLKGASTEELTRAVKHSMVVIDAPKHKLDYKKSEQDNGIAALKKKYQSYTDAYGKEHSGGAATLISRAKSKERVLKRVGTPKINQKGKPWYDPNKPEGAIIYTEKKETYIDKNGKEQVIMQKSTKMREASDARQLSSGTPKEEIYADYANSLKALANTTRKQLVVTPRLKHDPQAKKEYDAEVKSLNAKLNNALKNAPRERQAQLLASSVVKAKQQACPDIDKNELKKIKDRELKNARLKLGAKREQIEITDREWEAIQKGAITDNILSQIMLHANVDSLRERATPRTSKTLSTAKINKLKCMAASGYTNSEIAEALGVSSSTITKYL